MELFTLFTKEAPNRVFLSILLGALAGVSYALLIPIVLASLAKPGPGTVPIHEDAHTFISFAVTNYRFATLFAITCTFILAARASSQIILSRVAMEATTHLRIKAYELLMRAPLAELEAIGASKLMAAITTDVQRVIMGASFAPALVISGVTLGGMLSFLFVLNRDVFLFVIGAIAFGVVTYQIPMYLGRRYFERGRAQVDALYEGIRGLLHGAKELKLNRRKRDRYFSEILLASEHSVLANSRRGNTLVTAAASYGDLLSFFVIGVVAYIFVSYHAIGSDKLVGVIMALLYITGPVASILNALPQLSMATVSLRSIQRLFQQLSREQLSEEIRPIPDWQTLRFADVRFVYERPGSRFKLGPLDLSISRGEITFIVGGNGSGKSTFAKLISLHYVPAAGSIRFGDLEVDRMTRNSCRQSVSAIFADYYLFDRLLGDVRLEQEALVTQHLKDLELHDKVTVDSGRFSTLALSEGQKKRLALLATYLEDRPLCVFDEWAADQDPAFKAVFYYEILPALKARNKAVVVISHDDRYFDVADKLVVMEEGRIQRVTRRAAAVGAISEEKCT